MCVYSGHPESWGNDTSQTDKSKALCARPSNAGPLPSALPALCTPPLSPAGPQCETFSQPIRSNLCFILRPNALDIVKINCLVRWAHVLPSWCDTDVKSPARWVAPAPSPPPSFECWTGAGEGEGDFPRARQGVKAPLWPL